MKRFREFIQESLYALAPVVTIDTTGTDINIDEVKNELNRNIDLIFNRSFVTVEEAFNKLRKLLSMYNLDLPQVDSDDVKKGTMTLTVGHHHIGYDEFDGKVKDFTPFNLTLSFNLVDGLYKCKAKVQ